MIPKELPERLQEAVRQMGDRAEELQELRLRSGGNAAAVFSGGETALTLGGQAIPVTDGLLRELVDRATGFSPYTLRQEEGRLYLPLEGGCRLGLCGEAVMREGNLSGLRHIGSAAVRFARQKRGIAEAAARRLTAGGNPEPALIVGPPGCGKTTFLRDLIRAVSARGFRVAVCDERRELSAAREGMAQMDLGPCTDVLTGCPKGQGMELLLQTMNPQVLAVDELSAREVDAALDAACCGAALFATAHGADAGIFGRRAGFSALREAFRWVIVLREFRVEKMERVEELGEIAGRGPGGGGVLSGGVHGAAEPGPAGAGAAAAPGGGGAAAGGNGAEPAAGP